MTKATMMNALLCISVFLIMNHQSIHVHVHAFTTTSTSTITSTNPGTTSTKLFAGNARQNEIRRKVSKSNNDTNDTNDNDDNDDNDNNIMKGNNNNIDDNDNKNDQIIFLIKFGLKDKR
jgi:hypothetical protein